jgi:hypothetical protein
MNMPGFDNFLRMLGPFCGLAITEEGVDGVFCPFTPVWWDGNRWRSSMTGYTTGPRTMDYLRRRVPAAPPRGCPA